MSQILVKPFVLKDYVLTVDVDSYEMHCSTVRFVPSRSIVTWQGGTSDASFSEATNATWTCTLSYAQDWETPNSLAEYLLENDGLQKVVVFKPKGDGLGLPIFTATLILVAGDIGPSGEIVQPLGTLDHDIAVDVFREQAASLVAGGVDLIWIETMSDLNEMKAAIEGVRRVAPGIALVTTMTFDTRGHTMMGVSPSHATFDSPGSSSDVAHTRTQASLTVLSP